MSSGSAQKRTAKAQTLKVIIDFVLAGFPELEVKMAWNVPQIHRGAEYVFGASSATAHLSLAPWSAQIIDDFGPRLAQDDFAVRKNLFPVPDDWSIDFELVRDLVSARLAQLDADQP